jgi:HK97 family phage major capsid protein
MELEQKLNEGMKSFETFTTEIKSKMDKLDGLDKEKFSKLETVMADAIAEQQKKDAEIAALKNQTKALEAAIARPLTGSDAESKEAQKKTSELFGEFMRKGAGSERSDFADFVARKGVEMKALSVGINQDGGYLVPATLGGLIDVRVFESSPIRQFANIVTISGAEYEIVLDNDEAASGWVSETASRPVTNSPTLDKRIIPTHELYANPTATQKLIDDAAVNMEAWLAGKVAAKFGRDEATAFVSGNGVGKPTGILTYTTTSTSYSARNVQVINSGTQGAFTYAGLVNLQNALKEPYQANARFLMKRTSFGAVINIKTGISGDNRPIFNMMYDKNAGLAFSILGAPVSFADDVPAVANDVNAAIYGDLRQAYTIVDRIGLRVLRDPYSSKPYIQYYTTKRVGGDVVNAEAVKILALSN